MVDHHLTQYLHKAGQINGLLNAVGFSNSVILVWQTKLTIIECGGIFAQLDNGQYTEIRKQEIMRISAFDRILVIRNAYRISTDQMMNKVTTYDLPLKGLALMIPNCSVQLMMVNRPGMTLPVFNGQTMLRVEYAWSAGKHAMADDWILDQDSQGLSPHTAILL